MKKTLFVVTMLLLTACGSKDNQFCECLKAGEELNEYAASLFEEEVNNGKAQKLKHLKDNQLKECANYQTMKGEDMLARKAECK